MIKNLLLFIVGLTSIISIHELGHLIAAKFFNVYCKEYSIGMGPKLFSHQFKETEFCIRALPIGGFVSIAGDNENSLETSVDTSDIPLERTLPGIARWKRAIIMFGGIFMNLLMAFVIYSLIICNTGAYVTGTKPQIVEVLEDTPAEAAGLESGDIIEKIAFENGQSIHPSDYIELSTFISTYDGNGDWILNVDRNGEDIIIRVLPKFNEEENRYLVGISFSNAATSIVEVNIFNCWIYGFKYMFFVIKMVFSSFISLFKTQNIKELSGFIGIYKTVEEVASYGLSYYIELIAMLSVNIGIFNAIPLPVLDGGRVLLLTIEAIIGKKLDPKVEEIIMSVSVILIMALFIYVTFNDIFKLIGA